MSFYCPHCKGRATIRTSRTINPLLRELTYQCRDVECGHTFLAWVEVYETLSPSAKPDPLVHLPMSEYARRKILQSSTLTNPWRQAAITEPTAPSKPEIDRIKKRPAPAGIPARDDLSQAFFSDSR